MTTIDDPRTALMQALLSGEASAPSTEELLAQLGASDPTVAMLAQYLARQRAAAAAAAEEEPEEEPEPLELTARLVEDERSAHMTEALRGLRRRVEALYAELEDLRARNEDLAAALGACGRCWGDDPACPICEGRGRPGGAPLDPYLYARLIAPAARRLNHWDPAAGRPDGAAPLAAATASAR